MNRAEFNSIFESEFLSRLKPAGFAVSGKHVFLRDGVNMTALIRMGGKYALLPSISWVLCFRHTFLRNNKDTEIPKGIGDVTRLEISTTTEKNLITKRRPVAKFRRVLTSSLTF